ncbi:MAG: PcfJ domain-containing protein [Eubacterium sp.]|nr:PcfJ domain-containing protein [Eubacterium sp.]
MRKNHFTEQEATKIWNRLKKSARPSKALMNYVHNTLLIDSHFIFQYKEGRKRYAHCSHCGKDFCMELSGKRTVFPEDRKLLEAKHNEKVICPCCHTEVTKRYAAYNQKPVYAEVADFKVDKSTGALIAYVFSFRYSYDINYKITQPDYHCFNILYFDLHKWFYILNGGWTGQSLYLKDKYISNFFFSDCNKVDEPFCNCQSTREGIKLYNFEVWKKSNLKYSCIDQYIENHGVYNLIHYLLFYCAYPVVTERLIKQGHQELLDEYFHGGNKGCFNFNRTKVNEFLKLDGEHYKLYKSINEKYLYKLQCVQFLQKHNIKYNKKFFRFLDDNCAYDIYISMLLEFLSPGKVMKYVREQGKLCHCRYNYGSVEREFFLNYKDYRKQCAELDYDLNNKNIVLPENLYTAHAQLTEIINERIAREKEIKDAKKRAEQKKLQQKFNKRLKKLKKVFCFSDGVFLIRPAESKEELYKEGAEMHHCVASYTNKHLKGETTIFLIRRVSEPDKSYYTLEYKNNSIVQCRAAYNGARTPEINIFLEKWKAYINNNKKTKEVA